MGATCQPRPWNWPTCMPAGYSDNIHRLAGEAHGLVLRRRIPAPRSWRGDPARTVLSTIRGTVTDETRAVIPGATITVTAVDTNVQARSVVSNDNGNFEAADLQPGVYRLRAELSGFQTCVADGIVLRAGEIHRTDVLLEVGGATEEVLVEAGAGVITTESGSITKGVIGEMYGAPTE